MRIKTKVAIDPIGVLAVIDPGGKLEDALPRGGAPQWVERLIGAQILEAYVHWTGDLQEMENWLINNDMRGLEVRADLDADVIVTSRGIQVAGVLPTITELVKFEPWPTSLLRK